MNAKHFARVSAAIVFAAAATACGDTAEPLVAAAVVSTFPANVSAVAGTSVSTAPGVKVTTAKGTPVPNVSVTFAVTGGAGSILGATQTTNANGEATVVYWLLGQTAGANTLTATVGSLPVVTITATGTAGPAAKLGIATAPSATAANRAAFPTQPAIQVQDQYGNFVATSTISVIATLVSGTGTLGGTTTATAVAGVATFTNLSVAGSVGSKIINFATTGLTSALAGVTTTAGAATTIAVSAGNNQSAAPSAAVATPPAVLITDTDGNPVSGAIVTYAVASGGGSITGANPTSNTSGIAAAGAWTLGPSVGVNTLTASASGLTGSPITFTAQGTTTTIVSVTPATLTTGATATITGTNFSATLASNAVTIDGVAATVTAASATSLTVTVPTLPCVAGHSAVVSVNPNATGAAVRNHPVLAATQLNLAIGQTAILSTAAAAKCNELANNGGLYYLTVYNSNTAYDSAGARFELVGATGGSSLVAPSNVVGQRRIASPPAANISFAPDPEMVARDKADRAHVQLLERDLEFLRQNGPKWRGALNNAALRSVAPVGGVSHAVGDAMNVRLRDLRVSNCDTWIDIVGRVAYVGTKSILVEDNTNALAGSIDTTYAQIGSEFDNVMEPILATNYGNALANDAVLDNNGRLIMVFTNKLNSGGTLGSFGLAGFVSPCDFFQRTTFQSSNVGEYFYATSPSIAGTINTNGSPPRWRWGMRSTIIHEVKHIVSSAERFSRNGGSGFEVSWLEETTARLSEELYERARYSFPQKSNIVYGSASNLNGPYCGVRLNCNDQARGVIRVFEELAAQGSLGGWYSAPQDYSPFGRFTSSDFSFYSTGWSLVRWMLDASANTEPSILKGMTQEPTKTGVANLEQASGMTFAASQPKWLLSMLVDDYPGFTPTDATIKQPSWNFRDVFAGYKLDFTTQVPWNAWPLTPTATTFGSWSISSRVRPGTGTAIQISGAQLTPQLIELKASGVAAAAPAELRLAIIRVQ